MLNRTFVVTLVTIAIAVSAFGQNTATATFTPVPAGTIPLPPSQSGPDLGKITKHANPIDYPRFIAFYRNAKDTCVVKVFLDDVVNVVTTEYWADVTYRETFEIHIGREGLPLMDRRLESDMVATGADPSTRLEPKTLHMFDFHCQLAVNRDIPPDVKKKFHGYLGVK